MDNGTCPDSPWLSCHSIFGAALIIFWVILIILWIAVGNLFVIFAIVKTAKLRVQPEHLLVLSLSCADSLVAVIVMPLSLVYEILGEWTFGTILCELWLALDVLFVTASILNLCMISLDRYWSVSAPLSYPLRRTRPLVLQYILGAWLTSLLICLPPLIGWHPSREAGQCTLSTEVSYVLYSAIGSFYLPVLVLLFVYAKIYGISNRISRQRKREANRMVEALSLTLTTPNSESMDGGKEPLVSGEKSTSKVSRSSKLSSQVDRRCQLRSAEHRHRQLRKRERQASLTLGSILAAFILCWLPFFLLYLLGAFGYHAPGLLFNICFWMGYCNSGLNPLIYTLFNREFRGAFKRLAKCRNMDSRRQFDSRIAVRKNGFDRSLTKL